jgi:6-pyruvoyltetrahydropterin/6-carboxytetrahydropterin synthase
MTFELLRRYRFEAAHRLPTVPVDHRCARIHGHTYDLEIVVRGPLDAHTGWVVDYEKIDEAVEPLVAQLDHRCLNDIEGLENPTSEHVARWLWDRLENPLGGLFAVTIAENPDSACTYRGEGRRA